jgi:hypothetical protein
MSEKAKAQIEVWDPEAVREVLEEMGVVFTEDTTWTGYRSHQNQPADFVVSKAQVGGHYGDVGFEQRDGKLNMIYDDLDAGAGRTSKFLSEFKKRYSLTATRRLLERYGYRIEEHEDGTFSAHSTMKSAQRMSQHGHGRSAGRQTLRQRLGRG